MSDAKRRPKTAVRMLLLDKHAAVGSVKSVLPRVLENVSLIQLISRSPVPISGAGTSIPAPCGESKQRVSTHKISPHAKFPSLRATYPESCYRRPLSKPSRVRLFPYLVQAHQYLALCTRKLVGTLWNINLHFNVVNLFSFLYCFGVISFGASYILKLLFV